MLMETTRTPGSDTCQHWWIEAEDDVPSHRHFLCQMCDSERWFRPPNV